MVPNQVRLEDYASTLNRRGGITISVDLQEGCNTRTVIAEILYSQMVLLSQTYNTINAKVCYQIYLSSRFYT